MDTRFPAGSRGTASMMASLRAKSTTDGGSVSDGSRTSAHLQDRDPSDSSLSSRAESLVDSQVSRASSVFSTGLQTVGLKVGTTSKPTGNEDRAPAGMKKKWQQHYAHGKWIQLGKTFCQTACVLFFVTCLLWSQLCYPLALNSKTLFEAIIDGNDQAASGPTYNKWLLGLFSDEEELTGAYSLHNIYMWHITNPSEVLDQGFKPKLAETGPLGYLKRTTKYDVRFSADFSDTVTYRSWTVYDPVEDPSDCTDMFFRMDKARLRQGIMDCNTTSCDCVGDTQQVTVVNPPFLKLMQQYEPSGIISTLSQEVFADIKEGMTEGFVRATKAYILPTVLNDVYSFRKAFLTADSVLRSIFSSISATDGTATAVSTLRSSYDDTSVDCQDFQPSGYSNSCPWGLLSFIRSAATSLGVDGSFSEAEAEHLLGLRSPTNGSIFDSSGGTLKWIAAGRYEGYLSAPSLPHPSEVDLTGESAFNDLVATVCTWQATDGGSAPSSQECQAKVSGILQWLFGVWFTEENKLEGYVIDEWRGASSGTIDVICDAVGSVCPWRVANGTNAAAWNISTAAAVLMIDPAERDSRNDLSHYTVDGQTLWGSAYTYCTADFLTPIECDEGSRYVDAANETLPELLRSAEGSLEWAQYREQVCGIASNIFGSWVRESTWLNHIIVNHINTSVFELTGYELDGDSIEDIGYAQWATGAVSFALLGLQTLGTIAHDGIWRFMEESRHNLGPELSTQVALAGYSNMRNVTIEYGKALLDLLAEDSDEADEFRRFIVRQSTTYYGDSDNWWEGPSSTSGSFDPGDVLFIQENPYGDFSSAAWEGTALSSEVTGLQSWLDTSFMSSPEQCYVLEGFYERCLAKVADGEEWPTNCNFFQTIISDTVSGIECDATRIYDNAHSYPKKPGNVVAAFMHTLALEEASPRRGVLKKDHLLCDDPENCDYTKGGYFTTQRARDIIFEGYTESLTVKLMNKRLSGRNLTIKCSVPSVVLWDMYCHPLFDGDCTNTGFEVVHDTYGTVLEVNKTGSSRHLWYSAELSLPHDLGSIDNPIFAVYPGGHWDNETFQKTMDCEKRVLQGEAGLWNSCDTTVETGSDDPQRIGRTNLYYGNDSLLAAVGSHSSLEVYGTDGTQDTPRKWEGFGEYKLVYRLRNEGLDYLGNDTVVVLQGEHLLQFHMARDSTDAVLQYPTRYLAEDNFTLETDIRLNRYIAQTQDWLDARERVGEDQLTDFNGMPYSVPMGMVSTEVLTGYATFVSDPHFLTNDVLDQQAAEQMNYIEPDDTHHQSLVDVEPVTGKVLRRAMRLQLLFRIERSSFSPDLLSSESSFTVCRSPTKDIMVDGAGCFMYVPILWYDDQRVMDEKSAVTLYQEFLMFADFALETAWKGLIASATLAVFGSILWIVFVVLKARHDRRVWVD
ncbi:unnamed protein product [Ectocarpus sp. 13 AM-2016]